MGGRKGDGSEEDKRFVKIAQPFLTWLADADEEETGDSEEDNDDD